MAFIDNYMLEYLKLTLMLLECCIITVQNFIELQYTCNILKVISSP